MSQISNISSNFNESFSVDFELNSPNSNEQLEKCKVKNEFLNDSNIEILFRLVLSNRDWDSWSIIDTQKSIQLIIVAVGEIDLERAAYLVDQVEDSSIEKGSIFLELSRLAKKQNQFQKSEEFYVCAQKIIDKGPCSNKELAILYDFQRVFDPKSGEKTYQALHNFYQNCPLFLDDIIQHGQMLDCCFLERQAEDKNWLEHFKQVKAIIFERIKDSVNEDGRYANLLINKVLDVEMKENLFDEAQQTINMLNQMINRSDYPEDYEFCLVSAIKTQADIDINQAKGMIDRKWESLDYYYEAFLYAFKTCPDIDITQIDEENIVNLLIKQFEVEMNQKKPIALSTLEYAKSKFNSGNKCDNLGEILKSEIKHNLSSARQTAQTLAEVIQKGDKITTKGVLTFIQYILKDQDHSMIRWFE